MLIEATATWYVFQDRKSKTFNIILSSFLTPIYHILPVGLSNRRYCYKESNSIFTYLSLQKMYLTRQGWYIIVTIFTYIQLGYKFYNYKANSTYNNAGAGFIDGVTLRSTTYKTVIDSKLQKNKTCNSLSSTWYTVKS